ncbi:hypothetical protein [Deinococcus sp. QL22]|uniref:hypothetical protein n=1 Tax=Deinococcus sp. QL22 TaxID=2939437 RepID=UPI002016D15C|nr:hypothetical protein [Deinococcus sp. QL22]UQN06301.1 hypothetical protein M1R55_15800 [Deinococcus sp. QL22]
MYGPDGELLEASDPGLRGGWREGLIGDSLNGRVPIYGLDRALTRQRTRRAFFTNPLFGAIVEIAAALLIGDEFTHAPLNADKTARDALDEFWTVNNLGQLMVSRLAMEYLLDGELCAVHPLEDPGKDVAARVTHLDMNQGVTVEGNTLEGITQITLPRNVGDPMRWEPGQFAFTAHNALWNDTRGWPVAMRAVRPAEDYMTLLQHRLNTHDLQGRILGVQTVFIDRNDVNSRAIFREKAGAYRHMPKKGGMLTLAMVEGKDGKVISDKIEFMTPAAGAANAEKDARAYVRLTALAVLGLPEHYAGEGGNTTRTTAESMSLPAIRSVKRIHAALRSHLDTLYRIDLKRRYGPDRLYTITTYEVQADGKTRVKKTKRVKADRIEVPWVFPAITQDSLDTLVKRAEAATRNGWASPQTHSGDLGYDPAEEADRMAAVGLTFGIPPARLIAPTPPVGGNPNDDHQRPPAPPT